MEFSEHLGFLSVANKVHKIKEKTYFLSLQIFILLKINLEDQNGNKRIKNKQ